MSNNNAVKEFLSEHDSFEAGHSQLVWFMTFADLVSLLLAFFVLLFAMKDLDQSRFKEITSGFKGAFSSKQAVVARYAEEMRPSENEVKVRNKDVLGYLDGLLMSRLRGDPMWEGLKAEKTPLGELAYVLPMEKLMAENAFSPEGKEAVARLSAMLRKWDNVVVLRAVAATPEEAVPLLAKAIALQAEMAAHGVGVLRQAEWRQPVPPKNGKPQPAQGAGVYLIIQGSGK